MVKVRINLEYLEKLLGTEIDLEYLEEILNFELGIEPERIEDDKYLVVDVTPNRPDLFSTISIARYLKQYFGKEPGIRRYNTIQNSDYRVIVDNKVISIRPYTAWAVVKDLEITSDILEEIIQLQELLAQNIGRKRKKFSIGVYPLKNVEFPIKYTLLPPDEIYFTPLEFTTPMTGKEILEAHPKGKEYGHIISHLKEWPVFLDNQNRILALVPIINSEESGRVVIGDKEVAIDVTGINKYYVEKALNIICTTLADLGGKIYSVKIEYPDTKELTPNLSNKKMKVDLNEINSTLGLHLTIKKLAEFLEKVGYGCTIENGEIIVEVPCYRVDVFETRDIIEDVAIAFGYNNFEPEVPNIYTVGDTTIVTKIQDCIRKILIGLGFDEVMTFALTNIDEQYTYFNLEIPQKIPIIENSVEKKLNTVRTWIVPELLKFLYSNKGAKHPIKLFDIDYVIESSASETGFKNSLHLAMLITDYEITYTDMRQVVDYLFERLDIKFTLKEKDFPYTIPGRASEIYVLGKPVGFIGELHPEVIVRFKLENPIVVSEINLSKIFNI